MYTVLSRRVTTLLTLLLGLTMIAGIAAMGKAAAVSASMRELPIYSVDTKENVMALGINCAWDDGDIESILDTLEKAQVKATFFMVGEWCDKYPQSVKKIAAAGHEIGSHSDSHADMTKLSKEEIIQELDASGEKIEALTGKKPTLLRCPSGAYNNLAVATAREEGWEVIQWDVDTRDWKGLSEEEIINNVTKHLQKGSIALLHSGAKNTAQALPQLIEEIKNRGFQIKLVSEIIYKGSYTLDHTGRQFEKNKVRAGEKNLLSGLFLWEM